MPLPSQKENLFHAIEDEHASAPFYLRPFEFREFRKQVNLANLARLSQPAEKIRMLKDRDQAEADSSFRLVPLGDNRQRHLHHSTPTTTNPSIYPEEVTFCHPFPSPIIAWSPPSPVLHLSNDDELCQSPPAFSRTRFMEELFGTSPVASPCTPSRERRQSLSIPDESPCSRTSSQRSRTPPAAKSSGQPNGVKLPVTPHAIQPDANPARSPSVNSSNSDARIEKRSFQRTHSSSPSRALLPTIAEPILERSVSGASSEEEVFDTIISVLVALESQWIPFEQLFEDVRKIQPLWTQFKVKEAFKDNGILQLRSSLDGQMCTYDVSCDWEHDHRISRIKAKRAARSTRD